jgi:uncharacterized membrane protein
LKITRSQLVNTFVTGALAALPLVATALIVVWAVRFLYAYLGPGSWFGDLMQWFGFGVVSEIVAYLIGVAMVLVAIFLLGVLVRLGLAKVFANVLNLVVQRIPVVRNIYDVVKSLVGLFAQRDQEKLKSMSPVWLFFGGLDADGRAKGSAVLGLLSTREPVLVAGKPYLAVIVPTAPVPVGGGLIYVPQEWVSPADVGVDGLTSIYVSMGVTSSQHLPSASANVPAVAQTDSADKSRDIS